MINGNFLSDNSNEVLLTKESSYNTGKKVGDIFPVTAISIMKITNLTPVQIKKDFKVIGIIENLPNNQEGLISIQTANKLLYNSSKN